MDTQKTDITLTPPSNIPSRIEAVKDFLRLIRQISDTSYFYLSADQKMHDYIPEPTCPELIRTYILRFLGNTELFRPCREDGLHFILDFGIHMIVIPLPYSEGYVILGPLRYKRPDRNEISSYVEKHHLTQNYHYILGSFLNSITREHASGNPIRYIRKHIYHMNDTRLPVKRISLTALPETSPPHMEHSPETPDMQEIDRKYEMELELRALVAQGKRREAGILLESRDHTRYFRHGVLNSLMRLMSYNIIYKQALFQAGLPPAFIEHIYASYIRDIASNMTELEEKETMYSARMLDDYCSLARDYAARDVSRQVRKIMNYILLNYSKKITVNSIAEYLQLTPNYISALFKKEQGITLSTYVNQVRINSSLTLLANTNLPVSEIAEKVGIGDYNYFSRIFKKIMGTTPASYRKNYRQLAQSVYDGNTVLKPYI